MLLEDGRVLVAGGDRELAYGTWFGDEDWWSIPSASAELFDPATETWTPAAAMHHPRDLAKTTTTWPTGWPMDGPGGGQWDRPQGTHGALAERYDPATDTWAEAGACRRRHGAPTVVPLRRGALGGRDGAGRHDRRRLDLHPPDEVTRLLTPLAMIPGSATT